MKINYAILFLAFIIIAFVGCSSEKKELIKEYNFENGLDGWHTIGAIQISQNTEKQHQGKASLKITGTAASGQWSFAEANHVSILQGKHYKFHGWVLFDSTTGEMPFFKCALFKGGEWLNNVLSPKCSDATKGEWQELTVEFDAPDVQSPSVVFALEKRPHDSNVDATIYIDDIQLEQVN